jgi:hypothetical protein
MQRKLGKKLERKYERINSPTQTQKDLRQLSWKWIFKCGRQSEPHASEAVLGV